MYGAVASMGLLPGAGPYVPVDPDALAYVDFVGGIYEIAQGPSSLTEMFSGTDPGGFSSLGMNVAQANLNRPAATGAFKTLIEDGLANGLTILFEMNRQNEVIGVDYNLMGVSNAAVSEAMWLRSVPAADDFESLGFGTTGIPMNNPGVNRIAFTLSRDIGGGVFRNALSANGSAITTSGLHYQNLAYALAAPFMGDFDAIKFGDIADWDDTNDGEYFRKIAIYPPMTDAELVALSAI